MSNVDPKWYAAHARSRCEQVVCEALGCKGFEAFYPRMQVMSRRKDRRLKIQVPILPGYVFVRSGLDPEEHLNILQTAGVVCIIGFNGQPSPADDSEIESLKILDGTDRTVQNLAYVNKGDRVRIMEGPFEGLVGFYRRRKGNSDRVIVSIKLLRRSVSVEIDEWVVERL
ncbi:MAG TPA: UpxY family transcription antiterminator [Desulfobacteraceae bacterium]|jgi:transcription termination/antitermination protein NusG|nr:UpxY family transcription antiterminator [Desulfobacteraceae bacterium]